MLTRWQIEDLLFKSEAKRAERMKREMKGFPGANEEGDVNESGNGYPSEDVYVSGAMRLSGVSEEQARADYRKALEEDAKNAKGK